MTTTLESKLNMSTSQLAQITFLFNISRLPTYQSAQLKLAANEFLMRLKHMQKANCTVIKDRGFIFSSNEATPERFLTLLPVLGLLYTCTNTAGHKYSNTFVHSHTHTSRRATLQLDSMVGWRD